MTEKRREPLDAFVNLPFDAEMAPLVPAIMSALAATGYRARSVLEVRSTGKARTERLYDLMAGCRVSVHELSRVEASDGFPRFNMPFELGMAWSIRHGGKRRHRVVVMESVRYRLQRTLSDLNGVDPLIHGNDPAVVLREISATLARGGRDPKKAVLDRLHAAVIARKEAVDRLHGGVFTPKGWRLLARSALEIAKRL